MINSWYNQQNDEWVDYKDQFGSRADFHPYRFLNSGRPSTKISDDYLVFGEGKHACPWVQTFLFLKKILGSISKIVCFSGRWFAVQEIKTIISLLLRDYSLTPSSEISFPTNTATAMPFGSVTIEKRQRT